MFTCVILLHTFSARPICAHVVIVWFSISKWSCNYGLSSVAFQSQFTGGHHLISRLWGREQQFF